MHTSYPDRFTQPACKLHVYVPVSFNPLKQIIDIHEICTSCDSYNISSSRSTFWWYGLKIDRKVVLAPLCLNTWDISDTDILQPALQIQALQPSAWRAKSAVRMDASAVQQPDRLWEETISEIDRWGGAWFKAAVMLFRWEGWEQSRAGRVAIVSLMMFKASLFTASRGDVMEFG